MTQKKLKYKYGTHATRPICLPKIGSDLRILKTIQSEGFLNCKLAGWGVTDADGFRASPVLKQVVLPWINNEVCLNKNNEFKIFKSSSKLTTAILYNIIVLGMLYL